ncbi:OmpA family protein [Phaeodactylibacter luteus]|nr:OmpA family protein [Phaeodactylibacter luteus]
MMKKQIFPFFFLCCAWPWLATAQVTVSEAVNTPYDESCPVISADGNTLFFARAGHPQNRGTDNQPDIWAAYQSGDATWSKAVNVGAPVNSPAADYPAWSGPGAAHMAVLRPSSQRLLVFEKGGRFWQPTGEGQSVRFQAAAQSADGRARVFAREAGPNRSDLVFAISRGDGQWQEIQPLGATLNTTADEQSPFLAADRKTLYFASNRGGGQGGFDLYVSRRIDDSWQRWSTPVNLGPAVNTDADELQVSLPVSGVPAYFSRRPVGEDADIFTAVLPEELLPEPAILVKGRVAVAGSPGALPAPVRIEDPYAGQTVHRFETAADGSFQVVVPAGAERALRADVPGFFAVSQPVGAAMASADAGAGSFSVAGGADEQIRALQLHLRNLDEELIAMQAEWRQKAAAAQHKGPAIDLSDPEIEALQHRFNYMVLHAAPVRDTLPDDGYDEEAASRRELEDMKARFRRYYTHEKATQEAQEEMASGERHMWEEPPTFEELKAKAQEELEAELAPEVAQALSREVPLEVEVSRVPVLSEAEQLQLEQKTKALQQQIREGLNAQRAPAREWAAKGGAPEPDDSLTGWEKDLQADLKTAMRPDVEAALRTELRTEVEKRMQAKAQYQAKKLERTAVQEKLDRLVEKRLQESPAEETVAPLVLPAGAPPAPVEVDQDLLLIPAELGRNIPLNSVAFQPGSSLLTAPAYHELKRVLAFLNEHEGLAVEVGAHVGDSYSYAKALQLTEERATAIRNYLVGNGISEQRLKVRGYGKAFPAREGAAERVELRIIAVE